MKNLTKFEAFLIVILFAVTSMHFFILLSVNKSFDSYEEQLKINHSIGWSQGYMRGMDMMYLMLENDNWQHDTLLMKSWFEEDSLFVETLNVRK